MAATLSLIAAVAENGCIGRGGDLPWHIPGDLRRFKCLTLGRAVVMGRVTYESIVRRLGRPLPERESLVITRGPHACAPFEGVQFCPNLDAALAGRTGEVFVAGGAQVYALALPRADKIHLTRVHRAAEGDAFFPDLEQAAWEEVAREDHDGFSFVTLVRRSASIR
ncbi:MAG TPA: dihydrofolate reductase [Rhodospirillaceae bacterium]|jgi:dihydrofolate reductase|nr:dihydrofolate reductase [Alphaproteobacteria bacterium]HBH25777.1 dihydrofolate reductase [Rhodospirillaceae bacterium]